MRVGAVVLAAGGSARFGKPKQLAIFRGETFVRRIVAAANEAECAPIVVVVGRDAAKIKSELTGLPVSIALHWNWSDGLGSSIAVGLKRALGIAADLGAAILLTCDQPFVNTAALRQLIQLHLENRKPIVASAYADTLGIPAVFDRSCFGDLLQLTGDNGAKGIILARRHDVTSFNFPAAAIDIDIAADYEKLRDSEDRVLARFT
jgi:molybdenum cofactor cytidylyltransferase